MTTRKYLKKVGGFTLVELLIVIAILAIIALIVIAAINPIEQANRAKDTGNKADSSQLISAIDRYFTARIKYPWVVQDDSFANDDFFGFVTAADGLVGICAWDSAGPTTDCEGDDGDGVLITTSELKTEFRNRDFIDVFVEDGTLFGPDHIMIGKADQSDSTYACYMPASNSNRDRACEEEMGYTLDASGNRTAITSDVCSADGYIWDTGAIGTNFYVCVPE